MSTSPTSSITFTIRQGQENNLKWFKPYQKMSYAEVRITVGGQWENLSSSMQDQFMSLVGKLILKKWEPNRSWNAKIKSEIICRRQLQRLIQQTGATVNWEIS